MAVPQNKRAFQRLAGILRREGRPCWLCDQPIDYTLHYPHPESFSADHIQPVSLRPDLALVYSNLDAAHLHCNRSRGNRMPAPGLGDVAGMW